MIYKQKEVSGSEQNVGNNCGIEALQNLFSAMFSANDGDRQTVSDVAESLNSTSGAEYVGCRGIISKHNLTYVALVAISPLVILALSWTVKRRNSGKRPGCLRPIPIVDPCRRRFMYALFWGTVAYQTIQLVMDREDLVLRTGCFYRWQVPLILLANVLIYAFLHYPIVAGFSTDTLVGYLAATLWTWILTALRAIDVHRAVIEQSDYKEEIAEFFREIFPLLFIVALAVYLPVKVFFAFRAVIIQRTCKFYEPVEPPVHFKRQTEGLYVNRLFKRSGLKSSPSDQSWWRRVTGRFYQNVPYFRFSQTVVSTLVVSSIFIYYEIYLHLRVIIIVLPEWKAMTENTSSFFSQFLNVSRQDETVRMIEAYFDSFIYASLAAGIFVAILQIVLLGTLLPCYRRDTLSVYRGCHDYIPRPSHAPSSHIGNAVSYIGYQTIMFSWGVVLQLILCQTIALAIAWVVVVPLMYGYGMWIILKIVDFLPALFVALVLMIIQKVMVSKLFTQNSGETLGVNNRNVYSNYAYVAFFKNLLVGLFGALRRMTSSLVFSTVLFSRIDIPVLNRHIERFDNGFNIYASLITVENYHMNPCLVTFVSIVAEAIERLRTTKDAESLSAKATQEKIEMPVTSKEEPVTPLLIKDRICIQMAPRRAAMRFKWYLAYTLIRNPQIITLRKKPFGFISA